MKKNRILLLLALGCGVFALYHFGKRNQFEKPVYPEITNTEFTVEEAPGEPTVDDAGVIELPELTITVPPPKDDKPVLHGTEMCRWYERAGITAAHKAGEWLESTCEVNTCFLLVHDSNVPASFIMAGWLSEARQHGRDPYKDGVDLSVFTFDGEGNPKDHAIYYAEHDEFDAIEW